MSMKNKKIAVALLFVLYIVLSVTIYPNMMDSDDDYRSYGYMRFLKESKDRGYDYTDSANRRMMSLVFDTESIEDYPDTDSAAKENLKNYGTSFHLDNIFNGGYYLDDLYIGITNENDVDAFIKNNGLKNPNEIKFKENYQVPLSNEKYSKLFKDIMPKEKIEPEVVETTKEGYSIFSSSKDALVLLIKDKEIIAYAYIDNRYFDTRGIMNLYVETDQSYTKEKSGEYTYVTEMNFTLKDNEDQSYNKYKAQYMSRTYDVETGEDVPVDEIEYWD